MAKFESYIPLTAKVGSSTVSDGIVSPMQISVLQWNVWYKEDIHNIAKFLLDNPADIVCLQELTRSYQQSEFDTIKFIADSLGYQFHFQDISFSDNHWTQANAIFTKYPFIRKSSQWINEPTGTGHYDDEYRAYVEATLNVGAGRELTVGTTHMSYTNGFISTERKEREADKLASILRSKSESYIFTGDLNAPPDSTTIRKIPDNLTNAGPELSQNTWTTKPFSYDGFSETELNWRLDYIFSTDDVEVISANIIETKYSDHLPIYARFRLT